MIILHTGHLYIGKVLTNVIMKFEHSTRSAITIDVLYISGKCSSFRRKSWQVIQLHYEKYDSTSFWKVEHPDVADVVFVGSSFDTRGCDRRT